MLCRFNPPHEHVYPKDWQFGGVDEKDPRADPRWQPTHYEYFDSTLHLVHQTHAPLCDDQAIDEFTIVAEWGLEPVFIAVRRPGETKATMMPWKYDLERDEVNPL